MHKLCKAAGLSSGLTRTGNGARQILESANECVGRMIQATRKWLVLAERACAQRRKPESSPFAQSIACFAVLPVTMRATIPGIMYWLHICTPISGGALEPTM